MRSKPAEARKCPCPPSSSGWPEWGREIRRRQRGLLLLTAHRAKGLEFDHVVVLDGGWDKVDENKGRRHGRAAQALLRGHDPRPSDPCSDAISRTAPVCWMNCKAIPRCCSETPGGRTS